MLQNDCRPNEAIFTSRSLVVDSSLQMD